MTAEIQSAETRLNAALRAGKRLNLLRRQIKELNEHAVYIDKEIIKEGIDRVKTSYERDAAEALISRLNAVSLLNKIKNPDARFVLEARFIMGLRWEDVAELTHYSLCHAHRLARAGLAELEAGR